MYKSVLIERCSSKPEFNTLVQLRTVGSDPSNPIIPVTSLDGRTQGANIKFDEIRTYEEYKMRRKVEVLMHKNGHGKSKNLNYSRFSNVKGSGPSQSKVKEVFASGCNVKEAGILPPSHSGIRDTRFPGYILNRNIPFQSFL